MSFQERIGTKEDIKKRDKEYEDLKLQAKLGSTSVNKKSQLLNNNMFG